MLVKGPLVTICVGEPGHHPYSKDHEANMGPIWGRQDPGGPHAGPMTFAIWALIQVMACGTIGAKSSPEPKLICYQLHSQDFRETFIKRRRFKKNAFEKAVRKNIDHYVLSPMYRQQFSLSQRSDLEKYKYEFNWFIPKRDKRQRSANDVLNAREQLHLKRPLTYCPLRDMEVISNV